MITTSPRTTGNWVALLRPHLKLTEQTIVRWRVRARLRGFQVTYDSAAGPKKKEPASVPVRKTVCTTATM